MLKIAGLSLIMLAIVVPGLGYIMGISYVNENGGPKWKAIVFSGSMAAVFWLIVNVLLMSVSEPPLEHRLKSSKA